MLGNPIKNNVDITVEQGYVHDDSYNNPQETPVCAGG